MNSVHEAGIRASVVIPTLDEEAKIEAALLPLQHARQAGHEVILVDAGSEDGTREIAAPLVDRLRVSRRGRALQMNDGAGQARGDLLVFLHADTLLPWESLQALSRRLPASGKSWGRFDLILSGAGAAFRLIERLIRLRSRLTGIATGDQAIFVRRELFEEVGGYPEIPLMEDIALCKALKREGPPLCLRETVLTSSRRWEERGILRTTLLMWRLRLAFTLGADPERLARSYDA
jgi:rSAM/selenodomain-associated transferase 2